MPSLIVIREASRAATDGNRCRDPQPNIRGALRNLVGERDEGLWEPEEPRTPWENTQSQLTWAPGNSQRLNHQPENLRGTDLGLRSHVFQLCGMVFLWNSWQELPLPQLVLLGPSPTAGLPCPALMRSVVSLQLD